MDLRAALNAERKRPSPKLPLPGTYRSAGCAETLARLSPLLPILGITRVADVTGLDRIGIPVVSACRPNAKSISVDQGKGLDRDAARVSAIMESVEAYLAEQIEAPLRLGSYEELRYAFNLVDPAVLARSTVARFQPMAPMLWIEGYDLMRREAVWLPHQMVHLDQTLDALPGEGCFQATSTGLAAGNSVAESLVHALCETIERDAVTLWRLGVEAMQHRTRIDPASVAHPGCRWAFERLAAAGVYAAIWDTTSDLGVPTFLCQLVDAGDAADLPFAVATGSGCHPDGGEAVLRAVLEAAQARLTLILGSRDDVAPAWYAPPEPGRVGGYLERLRAAPVLPFAAAADVPEGMPFLDDIAWLIRRLERGGCDRVIAVDLSRPTLGLYGVRVVVPGLEDGEDLPTYVPGRRAFAAAQRAR